MSNRQELFDEDLENVNGGRITFTWSSTDNVGTIGLNGNNKFILLDKAAFSNYYHSVEGTMSEGAILKQLLNQGIIKRP